VQVELSTGSASLRRLPGRPRGPGFSIDLADVKHDGRENLVGRDPNRNGQISLSTGTAFSVSFGGIEWAPSYSLSLADANDDDGFNRHIGRLVSRRQVDLSLAMGEPLPRRDRCSNRRAFLRVDGCRRP